MPKGSARRRVAWQRRRLADETADELRAHLELLAARYVASGMTPGDARSAARRQLGNLTLVQEDVYRMNTVRWLDVLIHDVRYACRVLGRNERAESARAERRSVGEHPRDGHVEMLHAGLAALD